MLPYRFSDPRRARGVTRPRAHDLRPDTSQASAGALPRGSGHRTHWLLIASALVLSACAGPLVLERQVLGYDEVAKRLNEKLLLVNVARVANGESVHFTTTSSIAATFDWTTTVGIAGQINQGTGTNVLNLNLGDSSAEKPTFSILPVSGEEFTKRMGTNRALTNRFGMLYAQS